jgi:hypothetical protein
VEWVRQKRGLDDCLASIIPFSKIMRKIEGRDTAMPYLYRLLISIKVLENRHKLLAMS